MFYPYSSDYKCPVCRTGTLKWQGMEFHSTYVLGRHFCDNPECPENRDNWMKPFSKADFEALIKKAAQPKPKPGQAAEGTSEKTSSDDCNENHTH